MLSFMPHSQYEDLFDIPENMVGRNVDVVLAIPLPTQNGITFPHVAPSSLKGHIRGALLLEDKKGNIRLLPKDKVQEIIVESSIERVPAGTKLIT